MGNSSVRAAVRGLRGHWVASILVVAAMSGCVHQSTTTHTLAGSRPDDYRSFKAMDQLRASIGDAYPITYYADNVFGPTDFREYDVRHRDVLFQRIRDAADENPKSHGVAFVRVNLPPALIERIDKGETPSLSCVVTALNDCLVNSADFLPDRKRDYPYVFINERRCSQEWEFLYWLYYGDKSARLSNDLLIRRFRRLTIEGIFTSSIAPSDSIAFGNEFLSRKSPMREVDYLADIVPNNSIMSAGLQPLIPGDKIAIRFSSIPSKHNTSTDQNRTPLGDGSFGFHVRYLPADGFGSISDVERLFLQRFVAAQYGTHSSAFEHGSYLFAEEKGSSSTITELHDQIFDARTHGLWNSLVDPSKGLLSHQNATTPIKHKQVVARLFRALHDDSVNFKGKALAQGFPLGEAERWFLNHLGIRLNGDINDNVLATGSNNVTSLGADSARFADYSSNARPIGGIDLVESVSSQDLRWNKDTCHNLGWSLLEWQESRVIGDAETHIDSITFLPTPEQITSFNAQVSSHLAKVQGTEVSDVSPLRPGPMRVQIAWPGDDRTRNVRLKATVSHPVQKTDAPPLLGPITFEPTFFTVGAPPLEWVMDYYDLRLLATPPNYKDVTQVENYLLIKPISCMFSKFEKPINIANSSRASVDSRQWIQLNYGDDGITWKVPVSHRMHSTTYCERSEFVNVASKHAMSVHAWARFRVPGPERNPYRTINAVQIPTLGLVRVTNDYNEVTYAVRQTDLSSRRQLVPGRFLISSDDAASDFVFVPGPRGEQPTIHINDLDLIYPHQVTQVYGLTLKPLLGFAEIE